MGAVRGGRRCPAHRITHSTEEDQVDAELTGNTDVAVSWPADWCNQRCANDGGDSLMLLLYRSGRQADAVQRFTEVRALLRAELGVDPSPELQQLHRGILDQDEQLGLVDSRTARTPQTLHPRRRLRAGLPGARQRPDGRRPHPGFTGHLEVRWEDPVLAHLYRRLGRACRLVLMDKRGTGMSDRFGGFLPLPEHVDDVIAVMDAVGSRHFAIFGVLDGATIGLLTAVAHPERVIGLATYTMLPVVAAHDYLYSAKPEQAATLQTVVSQRLDMDAVLAAVGTESVGDVEFSRWFTRYMRMGAGVGGAAQIVQRLLETDIRAQLADVDVPVLVLHRRGDRANNPGNAEYLAAHLSQATLALLPGDDTVLWAGDVDAVAAAIEDWLPTLSSGR